MKIAPLILAAIAAVPQIDADNLTRRVGMRGQARNEREQTAVVRRLKAASRKRGSDDAGEELVSIKASSKSGKGSSMSYNSKSSKSSMGKLSKSSTAAPSIVSRLANRNVIPAMTVTPTTPPTAAPTTVSIQRSSTILSLHIYIL